MLLLTIFEFLNLATIELFVPAKFKIPLNTKSQIEIYSVIISIPVIIANYHYLVKDIPNLTIKYNAESKAQWNVRLIILALYASLSVFLIYYISITFNNQVTY
jgi:hypothetical protein